MRRRVCAGVNTDVSEAPFAFTPSWGSWFFRSVSIFIQEYTASHGRRCCLYESEFTLCIQLVRFIVDPRAVRSCYLEARFLGISYIPVAALCRVSLIMRVDHCSVGNHRKSGCGHAHCCHYPCFSVVIKCGDNTNWIDPLILHPVTAVNLLLLELGSWAWLDRFCN